MTDPRHAIIAEAISASRETLRGYLIDERLFSAMADQIIAALDAARPAFDLVAHLHRQREFSARTFGPGARTKGVVDHIRKELAEIEADPADIMEWVDVVILAFDGAWRAGWEPEAIVEAIVAKQTKNEARTWPDWRTADPDKAIEHVCASDAAQPAEPPADEGAAGGPLPCPFCGGPAKTYQYNGTTQAVCCSAEYVDCPGSTCDAPVAMWNRRAALDAARPVEPPADEDVAGLVERLKAEDARMLRLWDHVIVLRDKHQGSGAAFDLNGIKHAIAGRDPVLTEAADLIERQQAEIARLTRERDEWKRYADAGLSEWPRAEKAEAEVADLRAKLATAEEDTKRLDFLDTMNKALNEHYGTTYKWRMILNHNVTRLFFGDYGMLVDLHDSEGGNKGRQSCRDAIDEHRRARTALAAIKEDRT